MLAIIENDNHKRPESMHHLWQRFFARDANCQVSQTHNLTFPSIYMPIAGPFFSFHIHSHPHFPFVDFSLFLHHQCAPNLIKLWKVRCGRYELLVKFIIILLYGGGDRNHVGGQGLSYGHWFWATCSGPRRLALPGNRQCGVGLRRRTALAAPMSWDNLACI